MRGMPESRAESSQLLSVSVPAPGAASICAAWCEPVLP